MYRLIINHTDKKHFGCRNIVYCGKKDYLLVQKDRDDIAFFLVDHEMKKMYPINSLIKQAGILFDIDDMPDCIDWTADVSMLGGSVCPRWLKALIDQSF